MISSPSSRCYAASDPSASLECCKYPNLVPSLVLARMQSEVAEQALPTHCPSKASSRDGTPPSSVIVLE